MHERLIITSIRRMKSDALLKINNPERRHSCIHHYSMQRIAAISRYRDMLSTENNDGSFAAPLSSEEKDLAVEMVMGEVIPY